VIRAPPHGTIGCVSKRSCGSRGPVHRGVICCRNSANASPSTHASGAGHRRTLGSAFSRSYLTIPISSGCGRFVLLIGAGLTIGGTVSGSGLTIGGTVSGSGLTIGGTVSGSGLMIGGTVSGSGLTIGSTVSGSAFCSRRSIAPWRIPVVSADKAMSRNLERQCVRIGRKPKYARWRSPREGHEPTSTRKMGRGSRRRTA
jgi:hypothetical protein